MAPSSADVGAARERRRRRRLGTLAVLLVLGLVAALVAPQVITIPSVDPITVTAVAFFALMGLTAVGTSLVAGRSPHVTYRPEQIDVGFDDVIGAEVVKDEVVRSLNLFLAHRQFASSMGGRARRGLLFEGLPGTGKTHMAKAMAREAGVPFLFVSATSFQSMYYGATARKIRSYFKALRKTALREGGAIGFIEEIDAIAMARGGMPMTAAPATAHAPMCCGGLEGLPMTTSTAATAVNASMTSEGTGGVVNELLVQMQSFDTPSGWQKMLASLVDAINLLLPASRQISRPAPQRANVLLIAATNRADNLDPALLRPGRFDRRLTFEAPGKAARRSLVDYFLDRKSHHPVLDEPARRDALAASTQGYTPVMIEHLLDESLVNALRRGDTAMDWADVEHARLVGEVGLGQPVEYTEHERRLIATHEAGHATMAWLVAPQRRLEVLTIIKRREALGLLAHGDAEDVFTRSKAEMTALIEIAMGGWVAEEQFFGVTSTGPAGDLTYATNVAAQMVGQAGMSGSLVSFGAAAGGFGDSNLVAKVLADPAGRAAVEKILSDARDRARVLLAQNAHRLEALRDALLDRYELIGSEITDVLTGAEAPVTVQ